MRCAVRPSIVACSLLAALTLRADEPAAAPPPPPDWVERLAREARESVMVISVAGRSGKNEGIGTGFVVGAGGLIATNLHVIGEARPLTVRGADGRQHEVVAIEATDRAVDLAILRVADTKLKPLPLADSDEVRQGQPVVALGNPQGLEHSVVAGVVSGTREIDGMPMIQLAMPIEPGNSGGPLLDDRGRVLGVLTMKSLVTDNLGFAVRINALRPLLERPNPVPLARWLTVGALDRREWTTVAGAQWRQRAGRIVVDGAGAGFGGRSLCLSAAKLPELPYELAVSVKLDDEAGAAGLAFAADGADRHYGFYPTAGKLRLTRFEGPDVLSWQILHDEASPHYRHGDWNTLKVRLEKDRVRCLVNDQPVIEIALADEPTGQVGLAKFRDTAAEFKGFRVGRQLPATSPAAEIVARVEEAVAGDTGAAEFEERLLDRLAAEGAMGSLVLRDRAADLEREAERLKKLALAAHHRRVQRELAQCLAGSEGKIDLLRAALLVSMLDNAELDVEAYVRQVDRMADEVRRMLPRRADDAARLATLNRYLFDEQGFHGSRGDYYNRANSYLNEVLDDREGLPITLAIVYMELARRLEVNVVGVGLPGQFMVRHEPAKGSSQLIDVFDRGRFLTRDEADEKVQELSGQPLEERHLATMSKQAIVLRMLHNLRGVADRDKNATAMLTYVDAIVEIAPDQAEDRLLRAWLRHFLGQPRAALEDTRWLLDHQPEGIELERVIELHQRVEEAAAGEPRRTKS